MLQLSNDTGLAATVLAAPDPGGVESLYTVVKGTFALGQLDGSGFPGRADEQVPPHPADEHHGDAAATSIRVPGDLSLLKPGTDVLLTGTAQAPDGRPVRWMDVGLVAGPLRKTVRVFGDRTWTESGATAPQAFERMPLVWERAYGGIDGGTGAYEARNPVGMGFQDAAGNGPVPGTPLPNLEDPLDPIVSWQHRPAPSAFAPVAPHWMPRRAWAGTYDDAWRTHRAPYLPADFDPRFFQVAPEGLAAPGYFRGGEEVEVTGVTPGGRLRFRVPPLPVVVAYRRDGETVRPPVHLDTVLIETDEGRVVLVWRTTLACDKRVLRVREISVHIG